MELVSHLWCDVREIPAFVGGTTRQGKLKKQQNRTCSHTVCFNFQVIGA